MSTKQKLLIFLASVGICVMSLFIVFGDKGLTDLVDLRKEQDQLAQKNEAIRQKNVVLYREIERLNNDTEYIENVVRRELGVIGPGELIVRMKTDQGKKK
jgi:cell division protein FtsB